MVKLNAARDRLTKISGQVPKVILRYEASYDGIWLAHFGVSEVVLLAAEKRFHILRRHQPGVTAQCQKLPAQVRAPTQASMPIRHGGMLASRTIN